MSEHRRPTRAGTRRLRVLSVVLGVSLLAVSCTASASGQPDGASADPPTATTGVAVASTAVLAAPTTSGPAATIALPSTQSESTQSESTVLPVAIADVTNDGVLAAAVIIVSDGDLEAAIVEGLITEAEAEAALVALESGTLSDYSN